ncbi:MAG: hypothetical protein ACYC3I_15170, partial [Gemmataceae bacterium]
WRMAHGAWRMAHGAWRMAHGAWRMAHGAWRMAHGAEVFGHAFGDGSNKGGIPGSSTMKQPPPFSLFPAESTKHTEKRQSIFSIFYPFFRIGRRARFILKQTLSHYLFYLLFVFFV